MPRVGFESTIPAFEQARIVHAIQCTATVISCDEDTLIEIICFYLHLKLRHVYFSKYISETEFCLRLRVEPIH
jgi:hypothetical protein